MAVRARTRNPRPAPSWPTCRARAGLHRRAHRYL